MDAPHANNRESAGLRRAMVAELLRRGPEMGAGHERDAERVADEWIYVGCDLDGLRDALDQRCWEPAAWRALRDLGLTAAEIGIRVECHGYADTIGYAVSNGDLSPADALDSLGWPEGTRP